MVCDWCLYDMVRTPTRDYYDVYVCPRCGEKTPTPVINFYDEEDKECSFERR